MYRLHGFLAIGTTSLVPIDSVMVLCQQHSTYLLIDPFR